MLDTAAVAVATAKPSRGLHLALWVVQVLIGLVFIAGGAMKGFAPAEEVLKNVPWAKDVSMMLVRFIGVSELLGGLGMLLPSITRIMPRLTVLAALGLSIVMLLAAGFHAMRGEFPFIGVNVLLGGLSAFVAWGRFRKAPIAPRGT